jgi:hypothetical protein
VIQPDPGGVTDYWQDRAVIRDSMVDAVVLAPDIIRIQLGVCVSQIVKHDFPERWPQV